MPAQAPTRPSRCTKHMPPGLCRPRRRHRDTARTRVHTSNSREQSHPHPPEPFHQRLRDSNISREQSRRRLRSSSIGHTTEGRRRRHTRAPSLQHRRLDTSPTPEDILLPRRHNNTIAEQCRQRRRRNNSTTEQYRQRRRRNSTTGQCLQHRRGSTAHTTEALHRLHSSERYLLPRLSRKGLTLEPCRQLPRSANTHVLHLQHLRSNTAHTIVVRRRPHTNNIWRVEVPRLRRHSSRINTTMKKKTMALLHLRRRTVSHTIPIEQFHLHRLHKTVLPLLNRLLRTLRSSLLRLSQTL